MTLPGVAKHRARLQALRGAPQRILQALYAGGNLIEAEAERSITEGSVSGAGHIPSAPGEPPNADTRLLDTSIETAVVSVSPPRVEVSSNAPYALDLEFGTSKMAERPYMRPATKKMRPKIRKLVERAARG